jgi:UrcA family protein
MNKTSTTAARALMICAAATLGYSASAGSFSNEQPMTNASRTYVVRFQDLDLSKIDGATALYARLRHAARVVCDPLESREMGLAEKYRACMNKAIADAVASVNRPLVSQYHQSRTKGDRTVVQLAKAN